MFTYLIWRWRGGITAYWDCQLSGLPTFWWCPNLAGIREIKARGKDTAKGRRCAPGVYVGPERSDPLKGGRKPRSPKNGKPASLKTQIRTPPTF